LIRKRALSFIKEERGSVESHLTIIPLTILFLLTLQLTALALWQVGRVSSIEGLTNTVAIKGDIWSTGSNSTLKHLPLAGGGFITVVEESKEIPLLANFSRLISGTSLQGALFRHRRISLSEVYTN